jgi:hypothetical protein
MVIKRYLILILAILVLASVFMIACSQDATYSDDDVTTSFYRIAKAQTLPIRQDYLRFWSPQIILGKVKHIEKAIYEIDFPDMELRGIEIWRVDIEGSKIMPDNGGALLSAVYLFCNDRSDKTGD